MSVLIELSQQSDVISNWNGLNQLSVESTQYLLEAESNVGEPIFSVFRLDLLKCGYYERRDQIFQILNSSRIIYAVSCRISQGDAGITKHFES